ncbi:hypothetical protein CFAEC_03920 [Corynebacterium faecale]|uniref:hypothetical protein n=1 Tax=Corynebacterium faecale TaxID=1758466 RepID=UPI0025B2B93F|nr:hypothetical protein [Corynebacterium faecale]WJY91632.1 hypothetical protein CFAEC_03920 [Corynebacterium faecale]
MTKKRRRAFRASPAQDYDRTADTPGPTPVGDQVREVILDPEQDDAPSGEEFWLEQRPPHYH